MGLQIVFNMENCCKIRNTWCVSFWCNSSKHYKIILNSTWQGVLNNFTSGGSKRREKVCTVNSCQIKYVLKKSEATVLLCSWLRASIFTVFRNQLKQGRASLKSQAGQSRLEQAIRLLCAVFPAVVKVNVRHGWTYRFYNVWVRSGVPLILIWPLHEMKHCLPISGI